MSDGERTDLGLGATVTSAHDEETEAVRHLLDAAMLTVPSDLAERIAVGDVLVAVDGAGADSGGNGDADVVGALVLDGSHVDSIAVRKSRRDEGVGRALVAAAAERTDAPLTATFRRQVRPFYEALGFEIREQADDGGRFRGRLDGSVKRD